MRFPLRIAPGGRSVLLCREHVIDEKPRSGEVPAAQGGNDVTKGNYLDRTGVIQDGINIHAFKRRKSFMMYDVIIEAGNSAAIERIDPDNELCEVYFVITFSGEGEIENGRGTYHFRSMATFPKSYGDPRGFITTGKPFHGKTAIKRTIDATSLEEACRKFFSEWPGDDFQLVGMLQAA